MEEEIKNDCKDINKTRCMCEEDILNDILMCEKNISNNYSIALNEMSNKYLYKKVLTIFTETKSIAKEVYELMFSKGWYSLPIESKNRISSTYEKYNSKKKELS